MWIRVALDKESIHYGSTPRNTYIDGTNVKSLYFDDDVAKKLDEDGFLTEMWSNLDALFDWGDYDFFQVDKCVKFKTWLEQRLKRPIDNQLEFIYISMLELANLAIQYDTGLSFDF